VDRRPALPQKATMFGRAVFSAECWLRLVWLSIRSGEWFRVASAILRAIGGESCAQAAMRPRPCTKACLKGRMRQRRSTLETTSSEATSRARPACSSSSAKRDTAAIARQETRVRRRADSAPHSAPLQRRSRAQQSCNFVGYRGGGEGGGLNGGMPRSALAIFLLVQQTALQNTLCQFLANMRHAPFGALDDLIDDLRSANLPAICSTSPVRSAPDRSC